MHPDLSAHLHTDECNTLIKVFTSCQEQVCTNVHMYLFTCMSKLSFMLIDFCLAVYLLSLTSEFSPFFLHFCCHAVDNRAIFGSESLCRLPTTEV